MITIIKFLKRLWYGEQHEMIGYHITDATPKGFSEYKDDKYNFPFYIHLIVNDGETEVYLGRAFQKYEIPECDRNKIQKRIIDFFEFYGHSVLLMTS